VVCVGEMLCGVCYRNQSFPGTNVPELQCSADQFVTFP